MITSFTILQQGSTYTCLWQPPGQLQVAAEGLAEPPIPAGRPSASCLTSRPSCRPQSMPPPSCPAAGQVTGQLPGGARRTATSPAAAAAGPPALQPAASPATPGADSPPAARQPALDQHQRHRAALGAAARRPGFSGAAPRRQPPAAVLGRRHGRKRRRRPAEPSPLTACSSATPTAISWRPMPRSTTFSTCWRLRRRVSGPSSPAVNTPPRCA